MKRWHTCSKARQNGSIASSSKVLFHMGGYHPGTIVRLNNDVIGMVLSVNTRYSLKPSLLICDPEISKDEALIFDLSEDQSLSIDASLHPHDL